MAAIPITISGVLYNKTERTSEPVVLIGLASITGLGVGGGPVIPPEQPPTQPPGVPTHPIYLPPGIWPDPPEGIAPHPEHPIVIPPPAGEGSGPPLEVKILWSPETGWVVVLVPTGPHPAPSAGRRK